MIILNKNFVYSRIANILYKNNIPIIKFTKSKFCDFGVLSEKAVAYMQKYMNMFPNNWEEYEEPIQETGQITLVL